MLQINSLLNITGNNFRLSENLLMRNSEAKSKMLEFPKIHIYTGQFP